VPPLNPPSIINGLAAAWLFARGRAAGLLLIPPGMESARHSFLAAFICLPLFVVLRLIAWWVQGAPPSGVAVALAGELVGYSLGWVGFALASKILAEQAKRGEQWPRFIAVWNWTNIVQYLLLVVLLVPAVLGLPAWIGNALGLAAVGYAMWLEWFVTRTVLGVHSATAVMFVLLDLALGLFIGGITGRISGT
jgi:hypothetical protein